MVRRAALVLAIPFLLACPGLGDEDGGDVPESPTWNEHVQAILADHCAACHTDTPQNGAPDGFRFDAYEGDADDLGAFDMRCDIRNRAVNGAPSFMPPSGALGATERATLERWIEQGGRESAEDPIGTPCS